MKVSRGELYYVYAVLVIIAVVIAFMGTGERTCSVSLRDPSHELVVGTPIYRCP